ncbi:hypothetical protein SNOG_06298 [Parastagonospora nodorum SN15]|uniref:Uncharacterized protein n=1 Tax=Phaeosphaeria nodorum (strain SN15 / ATCC MYA-4574 / FGSC 10173) TaxID=321614 RepID=Q0UPL6_PHANO|nr:hypothetical protein SNOG_06298 [Parastagonospora nodorum SN15]EAT86129.1 hypothetical protein SNOG_06298 [Parastagonospora nodorum SN15]
MHSPRMLRRSSVLDPSKFVATVFDRHIRRWSLDGGFNSSASTYKSKQTQ